MHAPLAGVTQPHLQPARAGERQPVEKNIGSSHEPSLTIVAREQVQNLLPRVVFADYADEQATHESLDWRVLLRLADHGLEQRRVFGRAFAAFAHVPRHIPRHFRQLLGRALVWCVAADDDALIVVAHLPLGHHANALHVPRVRARQLDGEDATMFDECWLAPSPLAHWRRFLAALAVERVTLLAVERAGVRHVADVQIAVAAHHADLLLVQFDHVVAVLRVVATSLGATSTNLNRGTAAHWAHRALHVVVDQRRF